MLPNIVNTSGTSLNISNPIKIEKSILVYSKGAKKETLEYLRAVIEQSCMITFSNPIKDNIIKSLVAIMCQSWILNKKAIIVRPILP